MKASGMYFALISSIVCAGVAGLILTLILKEIIHPDSHDLIYIISLGVRSLFAFAAAICFLVVALMLCSLAFGKDNCSNVSAAAAPETVSQSTGPKPSKNKIVPTSLLPPDQQQSLNIV
ncbi:hypothetical protein OWV82_003691 [Melia azedarach]|uniref:Uncharacterized protein n=1 Tax=Melia azedarach TaxID=155640 RepID=A0ACC1YLQ1_MELAZ|nr:hypothetical protein OWV82_003691 [Melia azedarach]